MSINFLPDFLQERAFDALTGFITRQVGYVWDYEKSFDDVRKAVEYLEKDRDGVREKAEEDEGRYGRAICDDVVEWLASADEIIAEYVKFKEDHEKNNAKYALHFSFQNLDIRYHRSKTAEDIKKRVEELQKKKHDNISRWQGPPSSMGFALPAVEYEELDSRKQKMEDIKKALEDSNATMIGVHGPAGIGKTTLVIKTINGVQNEESKLFDMVIMANVTKTPDIRKIQGQIADMLGMTLQEESENVRAIRIRERLKKGKNTLIILDDMYAKVDLDMLGIPSQSSGDGKKNLIPKQGIKSFNPSGASQTTTDRKISAGTGQNLTRQKSGIDADRMRTEKRIADSSSSSGKVGKAAQENQKGCKVLLISEAKRVLSQMDVKENLIISIGIISSKDAEKLFHKKVGVKEKKNPEFERLATDISMKCHGLPLSIVTTAKALKNQSQSVWEYTLSTLGKQKQTGTPQYSTRLSYDLLENEEQKRTFLLCACMGQHAFVSDLVRLCIGLGFLEGDYTAREARGEVQMLLMHLKDQGLLSDSYSNDRFTMQNLIRNEALSIASQNNMFVLAKRKLDEWPDDEKLERYTAVFLHHCDVNTEEFPPSLKCPKLKVFHFHNNHQHFKIPEDFFQEMKELRVLALIGIDLPALSSSSMACLTKLRKLCLEQCINLNEELCINIGKCMKNLRILSFSGSDIKSLPTELKCLLKLQVLDISNCSKLKTIPPGVISSLSNLEELYMRNTLVEWSVDNREESKNENASLSELGHLNQLTNVDLQIPSVAHLPANLFFDKLYSYKIVIGSSSTHLEPDFKIPDKYQLLRYLAIQEKDVDIHSQKGIKMLFERVENLLLEELNGVEDIFYSLNLKGFPCLKTLSIVSTCSIQYLINPPPLRERNHQENAFSKLETLHLYKLNNIKQLCSRVSLSSSSFCKLKVVKIKLCGLLKNVFLTSMVKILDALETIQVSECNSLEEIVFADPKEAQATDASKRLKFKQLRTLALKSLPGFHRFCSITAEKGILFDEQVEFSNLERLELSCIQIHKIWNGQNPPFKKLVHLEVNGCGNLESLLTLSMARSMENLQGLSVSECDKMGHILFSESGISNDSEKKVTIFPNLKSIKVRSMKSLSGISKDFEVPKDSFEKLETLDIDECHKLVHVFTSNMVGIFQHISNLRVANCKSMKAILDPSAAPNKYATTKLQDVHLQSLPKLEQVFNQQLEGILKKNNLHKIWIQDCERLENIFSVSVAKTLENNFEELVVSNCFQLREIVAKSETSNPEFSLLKLATIKFSRLPKFKAFYPGTCIIKFSELLKNLSVEECDKLEPFSLDGQTKPILFPEEVINNLKSIQIESRHATSSTNYDYRRDNLEELHLSKLKDTKILYSFLHSNPNMKNVWLNDGSFEELVPLKRLIEIESLGVVPQLKSLKLTDLPNLVKIGFERDPILQRIESLVFQNCPSLETIAPSNVFLSNLTKLEVVDCDRLEYLISPSTARSLGQLNTMKVINCALLEEIVSEKGEEGRKEDNKDDKDGDIIFKQLATIELASLKNLESFCSSKSCVFHFPTLERFVVSACPKLKSFSQQKDMKSPKLHKIYVVHEKEKVESYWINNLQETIADIFHKKMFFKGMEELNVSDHLDLQQQWQSKEVELFNNLKTLKLSYCVFEAYAIPSNVLSSFKNLRELEVAQCDKISGVFEMNDTKMKETSFQLKKLTLKSLSKVTHVWQPEKQGILSFKNLQTMSVHDCEGLSTLFPIALAKDLKKLEELDVQNCYALPNIVKVDEAETVHDEQLEFPCLTRLELSNLLNLTDFCSDNKFIPEFPELNCLEVYICSEKLDLFESHREENQNSTSTNKQQPLFMNKDISKMEKLTLSWRHTQALSSWLTKLHKDKNLESLNELYLVDDVDGKRNFDVPIALFEKTPNLETLVVVGYYFDKNLEKMLPCNNDGDANNKEIPCNNDGDANNKEILGKLKELYLFDLDELQSISGVEYLLKHHLRLLEVSYCPKLEKIELKSSFNLKELHIDSCAALSRLFTSSAAKMFEQLEDLYVEDCESLTEIVKEEPQCVTEGAIKFKQLESITLRSLTSLECFYSGNATLELPSLIQLDIVDCSKMKVFSDGGKVNLSRRIQVSYDSSDELVFHYEDLNAAAKCQFLNKETISSDDLAALEGIWTRNEQIPKDYSSFKVKHLNLNGCAFLSNAIIPSHLLPLLTNLEELVVRNCDLAEAIFDVKDPSTSNSSTIFIPLKKLTLERLPTLKHVWNNDPKVGGLNFPCVEKITINECKSIKNLFPASIIVDNLRELDVANCEEMEEIIAKDGANRDLIKLQKLTKLRLYNLPKLRCFRAMMRTPERIMSSHALLPSHLFSSLKELEVVNCESVEAIVDVKDIPISDSSGTISVPLKKLTLINLRALEHVWNNDPNRGGLNFPCLEEVIIYECKSIKNLFPSSVVVDNLRKLHVCNCEEIEEIVAKDAANIDLIKLYKLTELILSYLPKLKCVSAMMRTPEGSEISSNALLPSHLLSSLNDLKVLEVVNCDSVEAIFDVKYSSPTQDPNIIDIPLKTMILYHLPTLGHVWNEDPKGGFRIPLLEEVIVNGCECITSLFPASVVFDNKIRKLDVRNCVMLEEIVGEDEAFNTGKENNKEHLIMFPCLTTLVLSELPAIRCIVSGMHTQDWPKLRHLVFAFGILTNDSESVATDDSDNNDEDGIVSSRKAVTPHLERLTMDEKSVMMFEKGLLDLDLKNIKYLRLQDFNDIDESDPFRIGFFPTELILSNIEKLVVADSAFKEIFPSKMPEVIHSQLLLKELELRNLQMLESIGLEHTWVASFNLTSIKVEGCTCLKYLFTSSTVKCLDQLQRLHISNCEALESVIVPYQPHDDDDDDGVIAFKGLRELSLRKLPKLESFDTGKSTLNFPSLEKVNATECNRLEHMFKFSTAKSLHKMYNMEISKCESLKTVVLAIQEPDKPHEDLITFPNLYILSLSELPNLGSFFIGNSTLKLPCFYLQVSIDQCKIMKNFSDGGVEAPNLWALKIDGVFCSKDNLNAAVSQQFDNRMKQQ